MWSAVEPMFDLKFHISNVNIPKHTFALPHHLPYFGFLWYVCTCKLLYMVKIGHLSMSWNSHSTPILLCECHLISYNGHDSQNFPPHATWCMWPFNCDNACVHMGLSTLYIMHHVHVHDNLSHCEEILVLEPHYTYQHNMTSHDPHATSLDFLPFLPCANLCPFPIYWLTKPLRSISLPHIGETSSILTALIGDCATLEGFENSPLSCIYHQLTGMFFAMNTTSLSPISPSLLV